jgi:hypothetical protein
MWPPKGDKKQALDLLAEVRTLLASPAQNVGTLNQRMQLAQHYSSLDSEQAVVLLESIILRVNQYVSAAVVLDGIEYHYLKQGEWQKTQHSNLGYLIHTLSQRLREFARQNPASARYLSNQLERPEIRLMAQFAIVQSLLGGLPSTRRVVPKRFVRLRN